MPARWIRPACLVLLAAAWALDLLTPQLLVVSILLNGPIALSSLTLDPRFTRLLVVLALAANAAAGYVNGLSEGGHWDAIAIGDRIISGFSFLLVGGLSIATERAAHEAGQSAARQERTLRERDVQRSIEVIRASVNVEVIERAIAREACAALHVDEAIFYEIDVNSDRPATYCSVPGSDVDATLERPPPAVLSLVQRVAEDAQLRELGRGDALGRLLLDTYDAPQGFVIPLVEHETVYGVLVLLRRSTPFEPHFEEGVRRYAEQAAIALARARLFVEISERNEELATANAALRERTEVIRDIVYALSHDLRTPLSAARMTM
ncbi:MAG TPA: GAF domain-containing protein, partial [Candidatus Baltobacteraceae bacterium]|nr:GAF domain-containing protein [Candidatus Baltobacteraceae bacterium]